MIYQVVFLLVLLSSCHKEIEKNKESTEYFPNAVGNYWEYEVYDSSQYRANPSFPNHYNVKVTIAGFEKLVDGNNAAVWNYEFPWGTEKKYFRVAGDTIKIYDTIYSKSLTDLRYPRELFIQPFYNGQVWSGKLLWTDSFYVRTGTVEPFESVFQISRKYIGQQAYYHTVFWFSPKIGFVKIHRDESNQGLLTNELWILKSYQLK